MSATVAWYSSPDARRKSITSGSREAMSSRYVATFSAKPRSSSSLVSSGNVVVVTWRPAIRSNHTFAQQNMRQQLALPGVQRWLSVDDFHPLHVCPVGLGDELEEILR